MNKFKIVPIVSYWSNLFFFVSNLSEWHWSARKRYNDYWILKTGDLTLDEKDSLRQAGDIFSRYGFGDKYWGLVLLKETDDLIWSKARRFFNPKDFANLRKICEILRPRFERIWREEYKNLIAWREKFSEVKDRLCPLGLISDLDILFYKDSNERTCNSVNVVLLISSPNKSSSGGANIGPGYITLEVSQTPLDYTRPVILVMWHEIIHSVWMVGDYWKMLNKFVSLKSKTFNTKNTLSLGELINEAVAESLFPYGYLAKKHFNFPSEEYFAKQLVGNSKKRGNFLQEWRLYSAQKLMPLVENYINQKRRLDKAFIEKVYGLLKDKLES